MLFTPKTKAYAQLSRSNSKLGSNSNLPGGPSTISAAKKSANFKFGKKTNSFKIGVSKIDALIRKEKMARLK